VPPAVTTRWRSQPKAVAVTTDPASARASVERMYAAYHAEIYAYLCRMLRDDELAADLAQETFVKAYRAFDTLADQNRARAWLYQIAGRTALDELRRRKIVRFVPWTGESRGTASSAEDLVLRARLSAELERALMRIPPRQRQALLLAELNEPMLSATLLLPGDAQPVADVAEVRKRLEHELDLVIDAGSCGVEPTTVIDLTGAEPLLLRKGRGALDTLGVSA